MKHVLYGVLQEKLNKKRYFTHRFKLTMKLVDSKCK